MPQRYEIFVSSMRSKVPFYLRINKSPSLAFTRKKFVCPYPKCCRKYKTKPKLNCHYNYRHKQKSTKATVDKCSICNKTFQRTKYFKEHMNTHVDDLPFKCLICGERFKWVSGCKIHTQAKHAKERLRDEF